jgi:triosephosphate isomerase (TIM)
VIAYEPVWAIGGHKRTDAERSAKMIAAIKDIVWRRAKKRVDVLYGGSINIGNVDRFLKDDVIDGFLVGSASVRAKEAAAIIARCG